MADTTTSTYGLVKPEVGASNDTWGTKLNSNMDAIDALIAATRSGTNILGYLAAVDGAGSGLDADKLDGEQGSYYRDASNLNAGTVPEARLPTRISDAGANIANWNAATLAGFYNSSRGIDGATNTPDGPSGTFYWIGHVVRYGATSWVRQIVWSISHTGASTECWTRIYNGGTLTWSAWERIRSVEAELDARYLRLSGGAMTGGIVNNNPMSARQIGMYWADMSSNINEGSALFGNNLYASFNGSTTDYKTTFTGAVGYAGLRLAGTGLQAAYATGATTGGANVTPTWHDVLDKGNYKGARGLGLTQANFSITAASYDSPWVAYNSSHTLTLPLSATAGVGAVIGPLKAFDDIVLTVQRAGSDVIKMTASGGTATSIALARGQQVRLVADGSGSWYAYDYNDEVRISDSGLISAVSTVDIVLPPGFRMFRLEVLGLVASTTTQFYTRYRTQSSGVWRTGGSDYRDARMNVTGGSTSGGGFSNTTGQIWATASLGSISQDLTLEIHQPRKADRFTTQKLFMAGDQTGTGWDVRVTSGRVNTSEDNDAIRLYPAAGTITIENIALIGIA